MSDKTSELDEAFKIPTSADYPPACEDCDELRRKNENLRSLLKELCEEWNEGCSPTCNSYGHDDDCKLVNIAEAKKALRIRAETAEKQLFDMIVEVGRLNGVCDHSNLLLDDMRKRAEAAEAKVKGLDEIMDVKDDALQVVLNYLNHNADALTGDDLVGDARRTLRFNQRIREIETALALTPDSIKSARAALKAIGEV